MANHYEVLGVSETASDEEIKKAYRKKAVEMHPDKIIPKSKETEEAEKKAATQKFIELKSAYDELIDHDKRKTYDAFRKRPPAPEPQRTEKKHQQPQTPPQERHAREPRKESSPHPTYYARPKHSQPSSPDKSKPAANPTRLANPYAQRTRERQLQMHRRSMLKRIGFSQREILLGLLLMIHIMKNMPQHNKQTVSSQLSTLIAAYKKLSSQVESLRDELRKNKYSHVEKSAAQGKKAMDDGESPAPKPRGQRR
jgi:curved DNA-binding protein CbpA